MNVNLRIDRLILNGVDLESGEADTLRSAIRSELASMILRHGLEDRFVESHSSPGLRGNNVTVSTVNDPAKLGRQIAQSVYGAISK